MSLQHCRACSWREPWLRSGHGDLSFLLGWESSILLALHPRGESLL